ncbi:MAG: hypothetical protein M1826_007148 [Phylliscum demangeonii]|nr:MAG: hypothetical protein M1826_007148 [Phylliscum demangeonii]
MRISRRLLANLQSAKYLQAHAPTGLTGLHTHPTPRSALLYLYYTTLEKLKELPDSSVYRQSTEALTRHRVNLVEAMKPANYDAWLERSKKHIEDNPLVFGNPDAKQGESSEARFAIFRGGHTFVSVEDTSQLDFRNEEWDGEENVGPVLEGTWSAEEKAANPASLSRAQPRKKEAFVNWEPEPQLDADQIRTLENQIGAGLIEEVVQVAEGELKLVDIMAQAKP